MFQGRGAPSRIRTYILRFRRPLLFQLSFGGVLVEPMGFEPITACLQGKCSPELSYGPLMVVVLGYDPSRER